MFKADTAKCTLFTTQIYDQLKDHYIYFNINGGLGCRFDFKNSSGTTTSQDTAGALARIRSLINTSVEQEVWTPCFQISSASANMPYYEGELNKKNIIGFDKFLCFSNPSFKNMSYTGDISIGVDWILNDVINSDISPVDGLLFWYKKDNVASSSADLSTFAVGDWIYSSVAFLDKERKKTFDAGTVFVKISSNQLQALPINVTGNNTNRIGRTLDVSMASNVEEPSVVFTQNIQATGTISWTLYNSIYKLKNGNDFYSIHIPDGDYFRYIDTDSQYKDHLSANLMHTFRYTYSWLIDTFDITVTSANAPNIKRLAYILATGPQFDKITYNYTSDTTTASAVNTFITTTNPPPASATNICQNIYRKIQNLYIDREYNTSTKSYYINPADTNALSVYSKVFNDIYIKLVNKYGLYIQFKNKNAKLNIHKDMFWNKADGTIEGGPNISIILDYQYWTNRLRDIVTESSPIAGVVGPGHSFYDQTLKAGPLQIKTDLANGNVKFESTDSPNAAVWARVIKPRANPFFFSATKNYLLLPEIKYAMFYKQGAMKIAISTCYIDEKLGSASVFNGKLDAKAVFLKNNQLSSSWDPTTEEKEKGLTAKRFPYNSLFQETLRQPSIEFSMSDTNDRIKLYSIMINFLRYNDSNLCNCESFYQETISRSRELLKTTNTNVPFLGDIPEDMPRTVGYRRIGYCGSYNLGPIGDDQYKSDLPSVSTKYSPPIKAYGGYDSNIVDALKVTLPDHPPPGSILPALEERNPNYSNDIKCYLRSGYINDNNLYSDTNGLNKDHLIGSFTCNKGFFHPHLGWIGQNHSLYNTFKNFTSVWIHRPDKKSRFVFKGVGFLFDDDSAISERRKTYYSTIQIEKGSVESPDKEVNSQTGSRTINTRPNIYSTYYKVDACIPYKPPEDATTLEKLRDRPCDNYSPYVTYGIYPVVSSGTTIVDESKINELKIKDISVQLNFLNFDNTRDMKMSLIATFPEGDAISSFSESAIVSTLPSSMLENSFINGYIQDLVNQNPNNTIVLLNKEFIQNYNKDFVITFSDYADMGTYFNDTNTSTNPPNYSSWLNRSAQYNDIVHPSYKTSNRTESACNLLREKLNNYGVAIINNKFRKWYGKSLIGSKFVLKIEIDNNYSSSSFGNILNTHYKNSNTNLDYYESNVVSNSLCNWKLLIDTYKTSDTGVQKNISSNINHPITELIDYTKATNYVSTSPTNPYYNGYNFLADLSNKKFLVPFSHHNAPFNSLKSYSECSYPKDDFNGFGFFKTSDANLRWMSQAILFATAATSVGMMFAAGGAMGGLVGLGLFSAVANAATASIYNWFANQRQSRLVDAFDETFYDPSYDRYGYGYPDKALIEVSNDGGYNWYTFDANIFKYNKTCSPIYKPLLLGYKGGSTVPTEARTALDDSHFNNQTLSPEAYVTENTSLIFKGFALSDKRPQITYLNTTGQSGCIFKASDDWDAFNASKLVIIIPGIAPFYVFRNQVLGYDATIDILLHNLKDNVKNRKLLSNQAITAMALHPYNGTFCTFLSVARGDLSAKYFQENTNSLECLLKIGSPQQKLGLRLTALEFNEPISKYTHLDILRFLDNTTTSNKLSDYFISTIGEGSWGFGSGDAVLRHISHILLPKDRTLINYCLPLNNTKYLGEILFPKNNLTINSSNINIGLFDNINFFPKQQNKILNKHPNYKDSRFYIYSWGNNTTINNSMLQKEGSIIFKDLLQQTETINHSEQYHKAMIKELSTTTPQNNNTDKVEGYSDDKYWISIDKEQYGVHTQLTGIKILDNIKYGCSQVNKGSLDCPNVCGDDKENRDINPAAQSNRERIGVKTFKVLFNFIASAGSPTIEYKNANVDIQKSAVETQASANGLVIQWEKVMVERKDLQISCTTKGTDTIFVTREEYWVPKNRYLTGRYVKASDVMDDKSQLLMRFKNITRKLKNFDMVYDRYILSPNGNVTYGGISRTDGMDIKNTFLSWICSFTQTSSPGVVRNTLPSYYKMLNEMIFRAFFGSKDGVEMKTFNSKTLNIFEWIPYEYDTSTTGCGKEEQSPTRLLE